MSDKTGKMEPQRIAPGEALAERFAEKLIGISLATLPQRTLDVALDDLLDAAGLCVAARQSDYIAAILKGWDGEGACTAIGHGRGLDAAGAALVNGLRSMARISTIRSKARRSASAPW